MADEQPRDFLERSEAHQIDEEAKGLFLTTIPSRWIRNELHSDYGKDYHVEITQAIIYHAKGEERRTNKVTGNIFYAQVKGTDRANYLKESPVIAFPLPLRHLTYFMDEVPQPVFLVVADVQTRRCYWLFVQRYLASKPGWRSQSSFTLHIPLANDLTDISTFETEVGLAINYMRFLRGPTVREAVDAKTQRWERMDPRIRVDPRITKNREEYHFSWKEPIGLAIRIVGDQAKAAPRACFD
jgi:Domain of unknown function (DUF4365)